MNKQRTEIGFADSLEDLKPTDWQPAPVEKSPKAKPPKDEIRRVAQASGFKSREASAVESPMQVEQPKPARVGRIYRTGRSEQLNLKVRAEDKTAFLEICDRFPWVQGYTFQRAIEALQRELRDGGQGAASLSKSA